MADALAAPETFRGQPCLRLSAGGGDSVLVALHGAHVLSWTARGTERLYLSPRALFDGKGAIRGGVPVCFPQFNERGPLPKHGFVRNTAWTAGDAGTDAARGDATLELRLVDDETSRARWQAGFACTLRVVLGPGRLQLELRVRNTGETPWSFTGALHTYLRVDDIAVARLSGLDGRPGWDALTDRRAPQSGDLRFDGEFDRVFSAAPTPLALHDGTGVLQIAQSASFADTVVWNPGAAKCAAMADMAPDSYRRMLCVEAAQVEQPVPLAPGQSWTGWQRLSLA